MSQKSIFCLFLYDYIFPKGSFRERNYLKMPMAKNTPTPREWRGIEQKYSAFEKFQQNPTRATLREALQETWYAERSINNIDYFIDENFLAEQSPAEIAETIEEARRTGNPYPVRELDGFGWATATEILSALEPDEFALLNTRSTAGMEILDYVVPNPQSASLSQYRDFCDNVREAVVRFPLRDMAKEITGQEPPADTSPYLIADLCFAYHYADDKPFDLIALSENPTWHLVDQGIIDSQTAEMIDDLVADGEVPYDDVREFVRAALRNELAKW